MAATRVAIVGAGPAGAFAADRLLRRRGEVEIDLFERLPTPWGLLRGGVAPDHQEIKRLDETFDRQTLGRGCRFFGNVEVGTDVSHGELMRHYTAVVYATGAQTDKSLGIPGEDLPGSWAATEFVAWYNGHPDYRELEFDLSARRAVVIGNGNVAADVTRILALSPAELERTDVADHALEALRESRIEEVVVLGRRGPAQAALRAPSCATWGTSRASTCGSIPPRSSSIRSRASGWTRRAPSPRARTWSSCAGSPPAGEPGRGAPDRSPLPALPGRDTRR